MTEMNTENNLEAMQRAHGPLLEVKNLQVDFTTDEGKAVHAVRNSSFSVYPGQWVAIVGESGSGKSTSAMAVLGLLPGTGHVVGGSIKLDGQEISGFKQKDFDKLRGSKMGLVPQDPMSNLNPGVAHRHPGQGSVGGQQHGHRPRKAFRIRQGPGR